MSLEFIGSKLLLQPVNIGGTPDALAKDWFDWAATQDENSVVTLNGITTLTAPDTNAVNVTTAMYVISIGFEMKGFPSYIEMDAATLSVNVPAGIRGATYVDESEVTQNRTWQEWADHYGRIVNDISGTKYIEASDGNEWLYGTELAILYAVPATYTILSSGDYKALLPVEGE